MAQRQSAASGSCARDTGGDGEGTEKRQPRIHSTEKNINQQASGNKEQDSDVHSMSQMAQRQSVTSGICERYTGVNVEGTEKNSTDQRGKQMKA